MNSDLNKNLFIIIERMWLIGALFGAATTIYFLVTNDNDSALFFFGFFILASLLYLLRKNQRKKQANYLESVKGKDKNKSTKHN